MLSFDVARTGTTSAYNLKVYVTKSRYELGEPALTVPVSDFSDDGFKSYSVALPEAGDYYVVFELYGMKLDNLAGLQKKEVAHDLYFDRIQLTNKDKVQNGDPIDASAEFIPLKDMAAADYTVKLYLNGEAVSSAEGLDVKASVKISKRFNLPFTAESETTVTWPAYFAVEFTDGTAIRDSELTLTITNESHFSFNNAGQNKPDAYSAPDSRKNPIDFGKGNESGLVQNFEICNWGSAPLKVKSISVPEGYAASVTEESIIPAKSVLAVDITFSAETPGSYNGDLKIAYVDAQGADEEFTLAIQGVLLDPAKWYATFDNDDNKLVWPAGSSIRRTCLQ